MNQGQVWSVLLEEPVQVDAVSVKTVNLKIKKKVMIRIKGFWTTSLEYYNKH